MFDMTDEDLIEFIKDFDPMMNLKQCCNMKELTFIKQMDHYSLMHLCHYWYFKDVGFKFKPHVCNKCSIGCIFSKSKRIEILNVKSVDYRCILCGISRNKAVKILNNSVLQDKGVINLNNSVLENRGVVL